MFCPQAGRASSPQRDYASCYPVITGFAPAARPQLPEVAYAVTVIFFFRLMKFLYRKSRSERQKLRTVRGAQRRVSAVLENDADFQGISYSGDLSL